MGKVGRMCARVVQTSVQFLVLQPAFQPCKKNESDPAKIDISQHQRPDGHSGSGMSNRCNRPNLRRIKAVWSGLGMNLRKDHSH